MTNGTKIKYLLLCGWLTLMLAACQPDTGCRIETKVTAGVTVDWLLVDTTGQATMQHQWDTVMVRGIGSDKILYNYACFQNILRLPLRIDTCQTDYQIWCHQQLDTLHIRHTNDRHYISMACGCYVYHTIDSVWANGVFIDSITILNNTVENYEQDNLQLHLRPYYVH